MTTTRLSDVVVPVHFTHYMMTESKEKSAIFQSGILRQDGNMTKFLMGGGRTAQVPFWKDLDSDESNIASDDPASDASPKKITAGKDIAVRHVRTQGWSSTQLSSVLAGDDPIRRVRERVGEYWNRQFQKVLVSSLRGVFEDNIANDSSDMVVSIGTDAAGSATDAELISAEAIIDTAQTMGDAASDLKTIVMHSAPYARLQKNNLIDFIPDSEGHVNFPTYLGYNVIVDDGCPAIAGTNRTMYWTFLIGADALCWDEQPVERATEVDADASAADGMGVEELWTRRQFVLHPYGVKWTDASVAGNSPTLAELADAGNWDRVYAERKQIPLALLQTNG